MASDKCGPPTPWELLPQQLRRRFDPTVVRMVYRDHRYPTVLTVRYGYDCRTYVYHTDWYEQDENGVWVELRWGWWQERQMRQLEAAVERFNPPQNNSEPKSPA